MAKSIITLTHDESAADISAQLTSTADNRMKFSSKLAAYLNGLAGGARKAKLTCGLSAESATGTVTFTGVGAANDTILVNGVTFTAVASGATGNQYNIGATATLTAASVVTAINASVTALVPGYVTASSSAGVVTITAVQPGVLGNLVTIAEGVDSLTHMAVSGARLTGGTQGTEVSYLFGSAT